MNSDVEDIKSKLNIVDVLSDYIQLKKAGTSFRTTCPFHNEKSPSFMVSEEKQIWHCFGCGKGGDIFGFVMEMEGIEFREALKLLADKAGVQLKSFNSQQNKKADKTLEILELATRFYEVQLWKGSGRKTILSYLIERGLTEETIKDFRLGYAPEGWNNILNFLLKRGYTIQEIVLTGLLVEKNSYASGGAGDNFYDRFRERIVFPISDYSGKILGYSARVAPGGDESQAKYVNTPETKVYHKSQVLYGLDKAKNEIKQKDFVLLVEGNMDVIASYQVGIKNTVAVSGTALTEDQINIIGRYTKNIKIFFDMDKAGEIATKKSVKLCFAKEMNIKIVSLPQGKDAAELAKDNPVALMEAVKNSLSVRDYFFKNIFQKFDKNKIEDKKKIVEEILDMVKEIENPIEQSDWIKKLSEEIQVKEVALTDMLKKANLKSRIEKKEAPIDQEEETELLPKAEVLKKELIGLMLISKEVWKKAEKDLRNISLPKDSLLNLMLEKGQEVEFSFEKLINQLGDDQTLRTRIEKLFFKKKFQLGLDNKLEEIEIDNPLEDFENCLKEIQKEDKKKELIQITTDLKVAEEKGDKSVVLFLRQEFDKISKELIEITK